MFGCRTPFTIVERTMTGASYVENIIEPIIVSLRIDFGDNLIHQYDNVPPHRTLRAQNILQENKTQRMNRPANSPDMNPIEHVAHLQLYEYKN